jgi:hypothetical protein
MNSQLNWAAFTCAVLGMIACGSGRSDAAFLTYVETATASDSLGGTFFPNATVTIAGTGDTSTVYQFQGFPLMPAINLSNTTVTVTGIGTATFTDPFAIVANNGLHGVDFVELTTLHAALGLQNPSLGLYDLRSPIGPLSGVPDITLVVFGTSLGAFELTGTSIGTFQATAAPQPSSLALCGIAGLSGLGYAWRRRKRVAVA